MTLRPGVRVEHVISGWTGEVVRHVPGKDGGSYRVRWDANGRDSLVAPFLLTALRHTE